MKLNVVVMASSICCISTLAAASDVPEFLAESMFATDASKCQETIGHEGLQLSKDGIFGHEIGCRFLSFSKDEDPETGEVFAVVAQANCGDDSGINRPDQFTLMPDTQASVVRVQSQNEYLISEMEIQISMALGKTFDVEKQTFAHLSQEYQMCK